MTKLPTIKINEEEDFEAVKKSMFGESYLLSKTKPQSKAISDRTVGVLERPIPKEPGQKGRRKTEKRWVFTKPPKQSDEPTTRRTISIPESLCLKMDRFVERQGSYFSTEVCKAMDVYLQSPK